MPLFLITFTCHDKRRKVNKNLVNISFSFILRVTG
jgi:hypothetical protein